MSVFIWNFCQPRIAFALLGVLGLGCTAVSDAVAAPVGGLCPTAGTVVTMQAHGQAPYKYTELGADPADPLVCLHTDRSGKTVKVFLHGYLVAWDKNPDVIRAMVGAFFSGEKQEVRFNERFVYPNSPGIPRSSDEHWKWTGRETIKLGDRSIAAWTGTASSDGREGSQVSQSATFAYDPASKLILRWDGKETMPVISESHSQVVDFSPP
jgi:hypothetical protein